MFGSVNPKAVYGAKRWTINITSDTYNFVLTTSMIPGYARGRTKVTVVVAPGVYVGSASVGTASFIVGSTWNSRDKLTIINNGYILGRGGDGGAGAGSTGGGGYGGGNGGPALSATTSTAKVTVYNYGTIGGGGGGGGGGYKTPCCGSAPGGNGGGGGQGFDGGSGGGAGSSQTVGAAAGGNGSKTGPGGTSGSGGPAGSGGALGQIGNNGTNACGASTPNYGAPGAAVVGNTNIIWPNGYGTYAGGIS